MMVEPSEEFEKWRETELLKLDGFLVWRIGKYLRPIIDSAYLKGREDVKREMLDGGKWIDDGNDPEPIF
jgi:hypothetical protein